MTDVKDQIDEIAATHRAQDEARIQSIAQIRRLEAQLAEALGGRALLGAPAIAARSSRGFDVAYTAWRLRGVPDARLPISGEHLVLVPRGMLVMARLFANDGAVEVKTRLARDTDLEAEDLGQLLELLRGVLSLVAVGRRGEAADRARELAVRCARALDPNSIACRADGRLDRLWLTLGDVANDPEVGTVARLIRKGIGGPK